MRSPLPRLQTLRHYLAYLHPGRLLGKLAFLYALQGAQYLIPLATIPFLARVLGVKGWGEVAFITACGQTLSILVDYYFHLSGTRAIARDRDSPKKLAEILSEVLSAKLVLTVVASFIALLAWRLVPQLAFPAAFYWSAVAASLLPVLSPSWFFLGLERVQIATSLELGARLLALIAMFLFVHGPADAWIYLFLQAIAWLAAVPLGYAIARRGVAGLHLGWKPALKGLAMGWGMFRAMGLGSLFSYVTPVFLGFLLSPQAVGIFAGADRIARAFIGLVIPLRMVIFPRISYQIEHDKEGAERLHRKVLIAVSIAGTLVALALIVFAHPIIRVFLGPGYEAAVLPLMIMSGRTLFLSLNNVIGVQWLLPLNLEGAFFWITLVTGLSLFLALGLLVPVYGVNGGAAAAMLTDIVSVLAIVFVLKTGTGSKTS